MLEMTLIAPTLEDMGNVLWGPEWRECLAGALGVAEDDVLTWENEPEKRPANLQDEIQNIGMIRIDEIEVMLSQMKAAGLGTHS